MRRVIRFYNGEEMANDKLGYLFEDILKWPDNRLNMRKNYINWLFPLPEDTETKLNKNSLHKFRIDKELRDKVVSATVRMMRFFGYEPSLKFGEFNMVKIETPELHSPELHSISTEVSPFSNPENYDKITRILRFLMLIRMQGMAFLFFLLICREMKSNPESKYLIGGILEKWKIILGLAQEKKVVLEEWEMDDYVPEITAQKRDAWN